MNYDAWKIWHTRTHSIFFMHCSSYFRYRGALSTLRRIDSKNGVSPLSQLTLLCVWEGAPLSKIWTTMHEKYNIHAHTPYFSCIVVHIFDNEAPSRPCDALIQRMAYRCSFSLLCNVCVCVFLAEHVEHGLIKSTNQLYVLPSLGCVWCVRARECSINQNKMNKQTGRQAGRY